MRVAWNYVYSPLKQGLNKKMLIINNNVNSRILIALNQTSIYGSIMNQTKKFKYKSTPN